MKHRIVYSQTLFLNFILPGMAFHFQENTFCPPDNFLPKSYFLKNGSKQKLLIDKLKHSLNFKHLITPTS